MMEEMERIRKYTGTPESRDVSPSSSQVVAVVSSNNSSPGQSSTRRDRPHDDQISEKKNSRKTFFVFGIPLNQAILVARIKEGYELPAVVYRCIEYLDANDANKEEGEYYDIHAVAGLLKLYLRELPTSVLTRELHMEFVNVVGHLIRIVQNSEINKMTVSSVFAKEFVASSPPNFSNFSLPSPWTQVL
ncbi:Rho GTPase activation protein [Gigaspora rosea]|uniref:Rho GTPase activation protein n=1 Tax=Gigaspora rosea TaxID=44941 RepID=A0A397V307_9GLOM|nr:Rho GTPase activation protein [Gigaspora rosea]